MRGLKRSIFVLSVFFTLCFNSSAYAVMCEARHVCRYFGYHPPQLANTITAIKCLLVQQYGKKFCQCSGLHAEPEVPRGATVVKDLLTHYPVIVPELNQMGHKGERYDIPAEACPSESPEFQFEGSSGNSPEGIVGY